MLLIIREGPAEDAEGSGDVEVDVDEVDNFLLDGFRTVAQEPSVGSTDWDNCLVHCCTSPTM